MQAIAALFLAFLLVGDLIVTRTKLVRFASPHTAMTWTICFAIGALGSSIGLGVIS